MDAGLREKVFSRDWYHTLELGDGIVTPGWFDLRGLPEKIRFPLDLRGKRCLDIGTFDGFWSFEMERRGADEVLAIDILDPASWDWPANSGSAVLAAIGERKDRGQGFDIAREAIVSKVTRVEKSVYDLSPEEDGIFDFVYFGSLLLHLRDPIGALMQARAVCRDAILLVDAIDLGRTILHPRKPVATLDAIGRPWWWRPNIATLQRMVEAAGFEPVGSPVRCSMPRGSGQPPARPSVRTLRSAEGRQAIIRTYLGEPHAAVHARVVG
jgi:tRNA (mo5U34)-methyltransferase